MDNIISLPERALGEASREQCAYIRQFSQEDFGDEYYCPIWVYNAIGTDLSVSLHMLLEMSNHVRTFQLSLDSTVESFSDARESSHERLVQFFDRAIALKRLHEVRLRWSFPNSYGGWVVKGSSNRVFVCPATLEVAISDFSRLATVCHSPSKVVSQQLRG